ncbi:MAG: hypothetical protein RL142_144 [Actinomycetota bacterium]|jgi:uncharacterized repeat protein (TIGR02543 family)
MNKHVAKLSALKSSVFKGISTVLAALLALSGLTIGATPAHALSVDASAASFNFNANSGGNSTLISGANNKTSGSIVKFSNVTGTSIPGVSIDAVVTATLVSSTISVYDSPGSASGNADYFQVDTGITGTNSYSQFKFDFYEGGTYTGVNTGIPIVLRNVSVTSLDLDGLSNCQFTDFTAFQSHVLSSSTYLQVKTNANDPNVPVGVTRFLATRCTNNDGNIVEDAVQVQYDSVTSFTVKFGSNVAATTNYFAIAFKPLSALYPSATTTSTANPSNQPPTSSNTTVYATSGAAQILQLADFGNFADPDNNPFVKVKIATLPTAGTLEKFVNGSWVAVALNDEITVADITNGNLRYTGSTDNSLQFKVSDGTAYSTSAYTMDLLMASQPQTINFTNPGTKTPTDPSFASGATATSGLTVTLTSLTPGVCTVSGLNIVPVAAGQCTIVATQTGNRSYSEAAPVTQSFPISTLTAQTITAPSPGDQTWSGSSFTINRTPTATSGLTVTMTSLSPSVCTVSGQVITIVGPGNCTIRNTQAGNGTYAPAPQVEYTFNVGTQAASYTITYDGNTSTGGTVPAVTTGNGSVSLRTNSGTLVKTGYTFGGWNTQADGQGTHYATGASFNLAADVTLYAEWTLNSYTVTYNGNNSTSGSVPAVTTGNGSVTLRGNTGTLVKTGYTLTGWNTNSAGTGAHFDLADDYTLSADVTLYAEWTLNTYTITYDGNTSTGGTVPSVTTGNGSVSIRTNSGTLVKTGYTFNGWNTQANGQGTHYAVGATYNLSADVTLYAEWLANAASYTITFDGNGFSGGAVPAVITGSGNKTLRTNSGALVLTNYTFKGWNTQANGQGTHYAVGATYNLTADVTLYAEWELTPQVIYNGNGATGGSAPGNVTQGNSITVDPNTGNLIRAGYRFLGWNTAANGSGTSYEGGETPTLPVGTVLYAMWERVTPLASTGAEVGLELQVGAGLLGLGMFLVAIRSGRRRSH